MNAEDKAADTHIKIAEILAGHSQQPKQAHMYRVELSSPAAHGTPEDPGWHVVAMCEVTATTPTQACRHMFGVFAPKMREHVNYVIRIEEIKP